MADEIISQSQPRLDRSDLQVIPRVEPDAERCQSIVLGYVGKAPYPQCSRRPVAYRWWHGRRYAVCRQHRKARWFEPWTAEMLMDEEAALRQMRRKLEDLERTVLDGVEAR